METKKESPAGKQGQKECDKDSNFETQYKTVYDYFIKRPATMFQCEVDTGVPRPYVCRHVAKMRKKAQIQITKLARCPISKYKGVQYLTTNRELFKPEVKQPSLFDEL